MRPGGRGPAIVILSQAGRGPRNSDPRARTWPDADVAEAAIRSQPCRLFRFRREGRQRWGGRRTFRCFRPPWSPQAAARAGRAAHPCRGAFQMRPRPCRGGPMWPPWFANRPCGQFVRHDAELVVGMAVPPSLELAPPYMGGGPKKSSSFFLESCNLHWATTRAREAGREALLREKLSRRASSGARGICARIA